MSSKPNEQIVDEQTRDKVFAQIKNINDNNICLDCEKKNPKWASIHLGIHLCLDCAGKHRQYGVIYSFIKSINLDAWNRKQLLFMEKGGNSRALEYFKKRGIVTPTNRHIDYKSPVVQQYKIILTEEVQLQLAGGVRAKPQQEKQLATQLGSKGTFQEESEDKRIEIPTAEIVSETVEKSKKKKEKKKIGAKQIVIDNFQSLQFDNGVAAEEKDKIVKQYEKKKDLTEENQIKKESISSEPQPPKIEQPKELSEQQAKKRMQELKQQKNLKNISSEQFKDSTIDNVTLKQNLNKFTGATSISSSAFFNKEEEESRSGAQAIQNIKDFMTNAGEKLIGKLQGLSSYWNK